MSLPSYPPNQKDVMVTIGEHPLSPEKKLIKICVASSIGYANTEAEAIQIIEELRNW